MAPEERAALYVKAGNIFAAKTLGEASDLLDAAIREAVEAHEVTARQFHASLAWIEDQKAEIKRLREALEEIEYMGHDAPVTFVGTELEWAHRRASLMQAIARRAASKGET
jgi:biotin carboxylase